MPFRKLRTILNFALVIFATLAAKHTYDLWKTQRGARVIAEQVVALCELPALPGDLTINHAHISPSDDADYVDTNLTLTGPTEILDGWLDQVDEWNKKRPGIILNHQIRESEMSSRVDFSAEVYLKPKS
ncbi:hypothetical protein V2O64_10595 [Verrucomicrobiaceae bacterium 227]